MTTVTQNKKKHAWSLSSLSTYEQCPQKWKYIKIDKMTEPENYFLVKGIEAHSAAENYLLGKTDNVLPTPLSRFKREFSNLRKHNAIPEEAWALDDNWNIIHNTPEQGAWTHPDAYVRMKLDARIDNYIIDFKTGKHYEEHIDQANLYSIALMNNSDFKDVTVEFWYLKDGKVKEYEFHRNNVSTDIEKWEERVAVLHNDTEFKPKKNQYCKYCAFQTICPAYVRA